MNHEKGYMQINNGNIYYEMLGEGEPLVFVHGNTLDHRMWDDQFFEFSKQYKCIRYDARGFGKSSDPNGEYSRSEDLKLLLEGLKVGKAIIVGLSLGGDIAIDFALEYANSVNALVLANSSVHGWTTSKNFKKEWDLIDWTAQNRNLKEAISIWINNKAFAYAVRNIDLKKRLLEMMHDYKGYYLLNENPRKRLDPPAIERVGEIKTPTLIVVGSDDVLDFIQIAELLEQKIENSKKIVIPDAGHMTNMEKPEEFNIILKEFLNSL